MVNNLLVYCLFITSALHSFVRRQFCFLMDEETVKSVTGENGLKLGAQAELTVGVGRNRKGNFDLTSRGVGCPLTIAYTKGAFAGMFRDSPLFLL